VVFGGTLMDI